MGKKRMTIEKFRRLERRTRRLALMRRLLVMCCGVVAGMVVVSMAMPQKQALDELEQALEDARAREMLVIEEKEQFEIELQALREDREFLEIHARDRLDFHREGERILKFRE